MINRFLNIFLFLVIGTSLNAQSQRKPERLVRNDAEVTAKQDTVDIDISVEFPWDVEPMFNGEAGGGIELNKFIRTHTIYPSEHLKDSINVRVIVTFDIDTAGVVSNAEVYRSSTYPLFDAEALRVISTLPKWTPATKMGVLRIFLSWLQVGRQRSGQSSEN